MGGPLKDVRVLDLTTVVMGPSATQMLGDLGADVIKIESPEGDSMRQIGPTRHPGMGPLYLGANRNKRGIVLDLKASTDRATLFSLIRDADVLVSNIRPQALGRLGLSYEEVAALNPSIIYCGAVGYGQGGPYAGRAVYDDLMQAASGVAGMFERVDGKPRYAPINLCDRVVGLHVVVAVLAAVHHRAKTGAGQQVEVPMFETMAQFVLADHAGGHAFVPPLGATGYGRLLSRRRGPYATRDGYLSLVVYTDVHWRKFCAIVGRDALLDEDARFASMQSRTTHAEAAGDFLAEEIAQRTTAEWLEALEAADIPACRVNSVEDLYHDPHLAAVGFFAPMDHPSEGALLVTRPPLQFSLTPLTVERLAPRLGEHSEEIGAGKGWGTGTPTFQAASTPTPGTPRCESPSVLVERRGRALWVTINRPEQRNALDSEVITGLQHALAMAAGQSSVRAVVLTGAGEKAFCAGADLSKGEAVFAAGLDDPMTEFGQLARVARGLGIPLIARVNGACVAGGMGLLSLCDLAVAADHARFGLPEVKVGVFPMQVMVYLRRMIAPRDLNWLCFTGQLINAARAQAMGLINEIVPGARLDSCIEELLGQIALASPTALRRGKYAMAAMESMNFDAALAFAEGQITIASRTRDAVEGRAAFGAKRAPDWTHENGNSHEN